MAGIRLYRPEEVVREYICSWHIHDEKTISEMLVLMKTDSFSLQNVLAGLDQYILSQVSAFVASIPLPADQILALTKLIYLQEKLYREINIFNPKSQKEDLERRLSQYYPKYTLPTQHPSEMIPQAIRIYNPLWRFRHFLQRIVGYAHKR